MTHLKLHLLILVASSPFALLAEDSEVDTTAEIAVMEEMPDEFDPVTATSGTLPSPVADPRSPSPVPKSGLFYVLPIIGLWMILRKRSHHGNPR
ncbi:MAG: hypothetical protein GY899_04740 [Verrucomicrobiaceae bacterium]|nr:hypothetical protein [Verrucomicrobiaceae bacterium]